MKNTYNNGADYWRDLLKTSVDLNAAGLVGSQYIDAIMRRACSDEEMQFCRELFVAMQEDVAALTDPAKLIYPYTIEKAVDRLESSYYHKSRDNNAECAKSIDTIINASCFETYRYNLELAAMVVIQQHGFNRVNAVLAHNLQIHESDGRYSHANK
jgi:hypothetical protein